MLGDQIYVMGGETLDGSGQTFGQLEVFDTQTQTWRSATPLPTSRHGLAAVAYDEHIYVLAGGPMAGLSVSPMNELYSP